MHPACRLPQAEEGTAPGGKRRTRRIGAVSAVDDQAIGGRIDGASTGAARPALAEGSGAAGSNASASGAAANIAVEPVCAQAQPQAAESQQWEFAWSAHFADAAAGDGAWCPACGSAASGA